MEQCYIRIKPPFSRDVLILDSRHEDELRPDRLREYSGTDDFVTEGRALQGAALPGSEQYDAEERLRTQPATTARSAGIHQHGRYWEEHPGFSHRVPSG